MITNRSILVEKLCGVVHTGESLRFKTSKESVGNIKVGQVKSINYNNETITINEYKIVADHESPIFNLPTISVVYQTESDIIIDIEDVIEYILILTENECRVHGVCVHAGFTNVYGVKERQLDDGTLVSIENHIGLVRHTTSEEIFSYLNEYRDTITRAMNNVFTNQRHKYTKEVACSDSMWSYCCRNLLSASTGHNELNFPTRKNGVRRINSRKEQVNNLAQRCDTVIRMETKTDLQRFNHLFGGGCLFVICHKWPAVGVAPDPIGIDQHFNFVSGREDSTIIRNLRRLGRRYIQGTSQYGNIDFVRTTMKTCIRIRCWFSSNTLAACTTAELALVGKICVRNRAPPTRVTQINELWYKSIDFYSIDNVSYTRLQQLHDNTDVIDRPTVELTFSTAH